jgi:hypothetical protein
MKFIARKQFPPNTNQPSINTPKSSRIQIEMNQPRDSQKSSSFAVERRQLIAWIFMQSLKNFMAFLWECKETGERESFDSILSPAQASAISGRVV